MDDLALAKPLSANSGLMHRSNPFHLLDHLVGLRQQRCRNVEAECPCGLQIEHELELGGAHHGQVELCYQPPARNRLKSRRFSSATRSRSTFRGKGQEIAPGLRRDGTIRRSFSRTAAGKLAGGGRVDPTPLAREAAPPPSKIETPQGPPFFYPAIAAAHVRRTVHFSRSFLSSRHQRRPSLPAATEGIRCTGCEQDRSRAARITAAA